MIVRPGPSSSVSSLPPGDEPTSTFSYQMSASRMPDTLSVPLTAPTVNAPIAAPGDVTLQSSGSSELNDSLPALLNSSVPSSNSSLTTNAAVSSPLQAMPSPCDMLTTCS